MIKIAFSGPNHSGKTSTLTRLYEALLEQDIDVIVFAENMHRLMQGKSIDEIRNNSELYLNIQEQCIDERIKFESELDPRKNTVVLIDRPLTDSLFYLRNYLDTGGLSQVGLARYEQLVTKTKMLCSELMPTADRILVFKPLLATCDDKTYRPQNVDELKHRDYDGMRSLAATYCANIQLINLNVLKQDIVVSRLVDYINKKL